MPKRWAWLTLIPLLLFATWYRGHTFGPTLRDAYGINAWPACIGETEPLDCDEAIYAYIGHRMLRGDVMYRDLTENKPPLGYWLYAAAVAVGGYEELAIRVMPLVPVLATIVLVWWIAAAIRGVGLGGVFLGAEMLVKQVAVTHVLFYAVALAFREFGRREEKSEILLSTGEHWRKMLRDGLAIGLGAAAVCGLAALVLILQGAGPAAYEDIFRYGPALATDTLPEPNAPSPLIRWLTGNADPKGELPWPFGRTDYLVWWGTGSWPIWLAAFPAMAMLGFRRETTASRRIVAGWTVSAMLQIVLPGLYWAHYYLLPVPGLALVLAICCGDLLAAIRDLWPIRAVRQGRMQLLAVSLALFLVAISTTVVLQVRDYLNVPPEQLTIRYKGGRQWVVLRRMGRDLARRGASIWDDPQLVLWGWQSPLYFYSRFDNVTPHVFTDNLLRDQAGRNHPLIEPRTRAIVSAIEEHKPPLVFVAYPPYPELSAILRRDYLPSGIMSGLWIRQDSYGRFETFGNTP